ncbi:MAG TPA: hypothetical protein VJV78_35815 [Polyangiales bacterium]|nr:hypothetical protein [Polyangiales bacterium]
MLLIFVVGAAVVWWVATLDPGAEPDDAGPEPAAAATSSEAPVAPPAAPSPAPAAPAEPAPPASPAANTEATAKPSAEPQPSPEVEIPVPPRSGPVEELQRLFEREPRASSGARFEAAIEEKFRRPEVKAGLLKSVMCRTTVCRIETRWSPERAEGFMGALMFTVADPSGAPTMFESTLAISPEASVGPDGTHAIEVYVKIAAPSAPAAP